MESILFSPKTKEEIKLLLQLARQMRIKARVYSEEDKEDAALLKAMAETEGNPYVSHQEIMETLKSPS